MCAVCFTGVQAVPAAAAAARAWWVKRSVLRGASRRDQDDTYGGYDGAFVDEEELPEVAEERTPTLV